MQMKIVVRKVIDLYSIECIAQQSLCTATKEKVMYMGNTSNEFMKRVRNLRFVKPR